MAHPQDRPHETPDPAPEPPQTGPPPTDPAGPPADTAPPAPAAEVADQPKDHPPAKKAAAKKAAPAKAPKKQAAAKKAVAKKAPAKQTPAKKVPAAKKAPAKKAAAKKIVPAAPESNGHLTAAAKDAAAHAKPTVEAASNPLPVQAAPASAGRSPVPFVVAIAISVLAVLLVRRLRQQDE
jgi:hypothetical protein